MAFGAHAGVDEDLGDGVFGCVGLLHLIRARQVSDVVDRMVEADVLKRVGYAADKVVLIDGCHCFPPKGFYLDIEGGTPLLPALNLLFSTTYRTTSPQNRHSKGLIAKFVHNKGVRSCAFRR